MNTPERSDLITVLKWMDARPGDSWLATVQDVREACHKLGIELLFDFKERAGHSAAEFEPAHCPAGCGHTPEEHLAFDLGVLDGERGEAFARDYDDSALDLAYTTGRDVGDANRDTARAFQAAGAVLVAMDNELHPPPAVEANPDAAFPDTHPDIKKRARKL